MIFFFRQVRKAYWNINHGFKFKSSGFKNIDKAKYRVLLVTWFLAIEHVKLLPIFVIAASAFCYEDFENLLKLGEYFNCSIDYLLRGDDAKKEPDVKSGISDDDLKFALFGTTEIDDETYDDVKAYAKFKKEQRKRWGNGS